MKYVLFLITVLFFGQTAMPQVVKDTLFFKNGTKVIGELKKVKLGVLTFDPDDANDITVQLRKIKALVASSSVFRLESIANRVFFGRIATDSADGYLRVISKTDTSRVLIEYISVLYPYHKSLMQRFDGSVGLGYSYTKSSGFGRLNFDGDLKYNAKKVELTLNTSGIYTITDSSFSRDREDVSMKNNYYLTPSWFLTLLLGYQRNLELGLQRRYQEGFGAGNKFFTGKHVYTWARGGLVLNQEKSTEQVTTGTLAEVFGQLEFNFFRFMKPEVSFRFAQTFYYSLSQSGRFRNDGETSLTWEVFDDFDLSLSLYHNYDSKPVVEGSQKLDIGVVFGLAYSF